MSRDGIIEGMARGLWLSSFADWVEELSKAERKARGVPVNLSGIVWDEAAPSTPRAAESAARELAELYETANGESLDATAHRAQHAQGGNVDDELFGYYLAMMALGSGVSWFDDHEEFELKEPSFEAHFDGEYFDWSGRITHRMHGTPPGAWSSADMNDAIYRAGGVNRFFGAGSGAISMNAVHRAAGGDENRQRELIQHLRWLRETGQDVIDNPAGLTKKGERMYKHIEKSYRKVGDIRAKEIAARTVYARAKTTPGIRKSNPPFVLPVPGQRIRSWDHGAGRVVKICEEGRNGEYTAYLHLDSGQDVSVPLMRTEYDLSPRKALERRTGFSRHEQFIGPPKPERMAKGTPVELDDTVLAPRENASKRRRAK